MTKSFSQRAFCKIVEKKEVAPRHFRFTFHHPETARTAQAGQFVHILPRNNTNYDPLLRRAFSIVSTSPETFDVLFKVMGRGTEIMSLWAVGEIVDLLGPLGKPFEPLKANVLLVGGGVGTPPMAMLASQAHVDIQSIMALVGARTGSEILCAADFAKYNVPMRVATDDGTAGHHGFVTDLLQNALEEMQRQHIIPTVYSCGPLPMLRSISHICAQYHAPCQVSLEENMPCGVGVCNGCVIPVCGQNDDYGSYRRICVDGPVAWSHEVDWTRWTNGESL